MKKLILALTVLTATSAPASYTNNQWQNGWPQHANFAHSWCNDTVTVHNQWAPLYSGYCGDGPA